MPLSGTYTFDFKIVDGADSPITAWAEWHMVSVDNGFFSLELGGQASFASYPGLFTGASADSSGPLRFLQVKVDKEQLSPNRRIVSAAYGLNVEPGPTGPTGETGPQGGTGPIGPVGP